MPVPKSLVSYYNAMYRSTTRMFCPHCNVSMLPKHFENHCVTHHSIDSKTCCVWCRLVFWPAGGKAKNGQHLSTCFKKFIKLIKGTLREEAFDCSDIPVPDNSDNAVDNLFTSSSSFDHTTPPLNTTTHLLPERHFFGYPMTLPHSMFQSLEEFLDTPVQPLRPEDLPSLRVPFDDDNLNLAARCVLLYLRDTHDFFHVMVRLLAWESFQQAMDEDMGTSHTLPFSCWCDGGTYEEAHLRQHRHAIVVSPKNHFESVWNKVKLPPGTRQPKPKYQCKIFKRITTPRYLVNLIGYLSERKTRCHFSFETGKSKRPVKNCHFYLYKTLPADFKLHLALLWDNGVLQLLQQTKFQNISVKRLAQGILVHNGRQWTQKIKDFYGHKRGLVIQVARDYVPTDQITPHFLCLTEGRKLYFEKTPEKLDHQTWLQKQMEGGNQFYDAVEDYTWVPRPKDQKVLNFHMPVVERNRELEEKVTGLEEQVKTMDLQLKKLVCEKDEIIKDLQLKLQQLTDRYRESEFDKLVQERDRLQRENDTLQRENDRLRQALMHILTL